jgi:hypothetical protein
MNRKQSKAEKAAEKQFLDCFDKNASGIQFDIMDLGNLQRDTLAGVASGKTMEAALTESVAKYRKN